MTVLGFPFDLRTEKNLCRGDRRRILLRDVCGRPSDVRLRWRGMCDLIATTRYLRARDI